MALSALRSISDAIDATRARLIPPALGEWGRFAVIVFFLGTPGTPVPANPQVLDPRLWELEEAVLEAGVTEELLAVATTPAAWPRAVVLGLAILAAVGVLYVLVGVLMRFVVVEGLRGDGVRIRAAGRRHLGNAARVVGFRAALWAVGGGSVLVVGAGALGIGPAAGVSPDGWLLGALGVLLTVTWLVDLLTRQFVIPVMIATENGVVRSWRSLTGTVRDGWREYLVYAVARPLLSGAVGVVAGIVSVVLLLALGLVFGTIGGAVVLVAGGIDALTTGVFTVLGGLGLVFLLLALIGLAAVSVPFQLYLWYYTLLVLGDIESRFDLIATRRRRIRTDGPTFDVVD